MLATLVAEPFSRENWIFEPKLDGVRCLVIDSGKTPRLHSRNKRLLNETYPELVAPLARQAVESYIADGRMQLRNPDEARRVGVEVFYYLFDLLYLNGYDLREAPLLHRKALLKQAFDFRDPLRYAEHQERDGEAYYRDAKRANSIYVSRRWRDWLKIKCWEEQEFIVGGFTDPKGARVGSGALLLGYYESGELRYRKSSVLRLRRK
jgi:bifunctional non-homologous end joining protein LigD